MTTHPDVTPERLSSGEARPDAAAATRPFYWSVRRELWENRSIYLAPLAVAAVALIGFAISTIGLAGRRRDVLLAGAAEQRAQIGMPYDMVAMVLIVTGLIVAVFYSIDALHGERRDRSILFWKSLPVSDRTTVLSKAFIPLVVIPSIVFALIVTVHLLMLLWTGVVLLAHGMSPLSTFGAWNPLEQSAILLYGLVILMLWHAPLYAWFLLVSGWARRAIVLWAVLPLVAFSALFRVAWGSSDVCALLLYRVVGGIQEGVTFTSGGTVASLSHSLPAGFCRHPASGSAWSWPPCFSPPQFVSGATVNPSNRTIDASIEKENHHASNVHHRAVRLSDVGLGRAGWRTDSRCGRGESVYQTHQGNL